MTLTPERRAEIEEIIGWAHDARWEPGNKIPEDVRVARVLLAALAEAERERDYWRERAIDRWEAAQRGEIAEREAEGDDADCPGREAEGE